MMLLLDGWGLNALSVSPISAQPHDEDFVQARPFRLSWRLSAHLAGNPNKPDRAQMGATTSAFFCTRNAEQPYFSQNATTLT
jgi:hypothetical protein